MAEEVDIRALKGFVAVNFSPNSLLRKVLAAEPDRLPAEQFVGKLGTWLTILREEAA